MVPTEIFGFSRDYPKTLFGGELIFRLLKYLKVQILMLIIGIRNVRSTKILPNKTVQQLKIEIPIAPMFEN